MAFQMRDGFPENGQGLMQRYQSWSDSAPYPQLIRSIDVMRISQEAPPEFYKLNLKSGALEGAPVPKEFENLRDRLRPGPFNFSSPPETIAVFSPIFRPGPAFDGRRPSEFGSRGGEEFRPRGPGGGPGRIEGATLIELDRDVILKDIVPMLVERHFPTNDQTGYRVAIVTGTDQPQVVYSSQGRWTAEDLATPDQSAFLLGTPGRGTPGERRGGGRGRPPGPFVRGGFQVAAIAAPWQLVVKHRSGSLEQAVEQLRKRNLAISFGILLVLGAG